MYSRESVLSREIPIIKLSDWRRFARKYAMSVAALQRGDLQTIVESSVQFGVFVRRPAFTGWRAFKSRNCNLGELLWLCCGSSAASAFS